MKLIESDSQKVDMIRKWNGAFSGVADAIEDVSHFLANGESHKGDIKYLQGIFNSLEILKSTVGLDSYQRSLCIQVDAMIEELAGHRF